MEGIPTEQIYDLFIFPVRSNFGLIPNIQITKTRYPLSLLYHLKSLTSFCNTLSNVDTCMAVSVKYITIEQSYTMLNLIIYLCRRVIVKILLVNNV